MNNRRIINRRYGKAHSDPDLPDRLQRQLGLLEVSHQHGHSRRTRDVWPTLLPSRSCSNCTTQMFSDADGYADRSGKSGAFRQPFSFTMWSSSSNYLRVSALTIQPSNNQTTAPTTSVASTNPKMNDSGHTPHKNQTRGITADDTSATNRATKNRRRDLIFCPSLSFS